MSTLLGPLMEELNDLFINGMICVYGKELVPGGGGVQHKHFSEFKDCSVVNLVLAAWVGCTYIHVWHPHVCSVVLPQFRNNCED